MCGDVSNENDFICISLSFEENLSLQRVYVVLIGQSLSFLVQTFQTEGDGCSKKKELARRVYTSFSPRANIYLL